MSTGSGTGTPITGSSGILAPLQSVYKEYVTLAQMKAHKMPNTTSLRDDTLMLDFIRDVCHSIDTLSGFKFYPMVQKLYYDALQDVDGYQLLLWHHARFCEITEVTNAGIGTVVPSTAYVTDPRNKTPHYGITLLRSSGIVWYFNVNPENALSVTGTTVYHTQYNNAWVQKYTLASSMNASVTALPATADPGEILKVDSEIMYARQASLVARGVNGSTAAVHDTSATVYAWRPEEGIEQLAREATVLKVIMRDDPTAISTTIDGQVFSVPKDIDAYIEKRLQKMGLQP